MIFIPNPFLPIHTFPNNLYLYKFLFLPISSFPYIPLILLIILIFLSFSIFFLIKYIINKGD